MLRCPQGREVLGLNLLGAKKYGNSMPGTEFRREREAGCGSSWNLRGLWHPEHPQAAPGNGSEVQKDISSRFPTSSGVTRCLCPQSSFPKGNPVLRKYQLCYQKSELRSRNSAPLVLRSFIFTHFW